MSDLLQARFDHFSCIFEQIDDRLSNFADEFGWEIIKRRAGRDLYKVREATFVFGIHVDGEWRELDLEAPMLYTVSTTVFFDPASDLRCVKNNYLAVSQTFDYVKANLDALWQHAVDLYEECPLPTQRTEENYGGFYSVPEGWNVGSRGTIEAYIKAETLRLQTEGAEA